MKGWNFSFGTVELEVIAASPEKSMNALNESGIVLLDVDYVNNLCIRFRIKKSDIPQVKTILEKCGNTVKIGPPKYPFGKLHILRQRPVLLFGSILLLCLILFLPTRILFVNVEGNERIPEHEIIFASELCGIHFGVSRKTVRSENVKNALLSVMPELQWAGINTKGCSAIIYVKERKSAKNEENIQQESNLVASRDGIVTSCTVLKGTALCNIGQAVKGGQLLISAYTDHGIKIQTTHASGEVFAQTYRSLHVITPTQALHKGTKTYTRQKFSLLIGKKRINFWKDSGISSTTYDRMYEEYYVILPGGYVLPIGISIDTISSYALTELETSNPCLYDAMKMYSEDYLYHQMVAGKISDSSETVLSENGIVYYIGNYTCTELISKVQK